MKAAYITIHDKIKEQIDQGIWAIGQRLPSERDLAEEFGVSRMTLRQGITLLVEEGVLQRKVGSGTYVANTRVQEKMRGTTSFSEIVQLQGKEPSSRVLSFVKTKPNEKEIDLLGLEKGEFVIRMERVRFADAVPVVYEVASIPARLIQDMKKEEVTNQFYKTLTKNGFKLGKTQQTIYARLANDKIAKLLHISKNHPILALRQVSYLENGQAFEFVNSQYVGERFEFYLENN
ncbi:TPA: GntR family transcriptional regulator [Streptococcus suis]|uniref:GntR family transcriptional regulator n=2 Tax=Streptococcus TaxID=1301 RepID=A0A4T2GTE8_STRSU|nr:GntR family transcriptional regulator [Streptococcus sp. 29896]MBL6538125.1 GntR family transcriptional regulator [Streptococcus suis]MBM7269043.1 GntR family transcriptional regulator [Streptococcus suis]MBM7314182.1 GntR family transcriptional regulator [Streptococcus suis]MCK4028581.1 GntR family transcriptional regulator [Streptococcus suis]TII01081.1 GntR family transcriptional regulator [Streptococcus suis]